MTIGEIIYQVYHKPKGAIQKTLKQGIGNTWKIQQGQKAMQKAAVQLQQPMYGPETGEDLPEFAFLTGAGFWYMTAFCAYSLAKSVPKNIRFAFYDDGSFSEALTAQITKQFPLSRVVTQPMIRERLQAHLPESKFPFLHHKRRIYPHIKKLTDVHAGNQGYQLLLDSDMLFWQEPRHMLQWRENPQRPYYMVDTENAYHYSFPLMEQLTGHSIPHKVNVGLIGMKGEEIDWEKLEYWAKFLEEREGSSYLLEQALTAMLIAGQTCDIAPEETYIVKPDPQTTLAKGGILHHYVAESKEWYFRQMWKEILP